MIKIKKTTYLFLSALLLGLSSIFTASLRAADLSLASKPLFISSVKPNVMVMLDNSGSMKVKMYSSSFDASKAYYGIFEADQNYTYDTTIPVNTGAYSATVDSTETGAFVESNCTPSVVDMSCWSGQYLNWLTTKRIDSSRKVLMGGKLESRTTYNYGTNLNYKIVANNERSDRVFTSTLSNSADYSPVDNNTKVTVESPAETNKGNIQASYQPYAKIYSGQGGSSIYNDSGTAIGEFGSASATAKVNGSKELTDASWTTVNLSGSYSTAPIVVAAPPSFNGADPGVVRIRNVSTTSFQINMQEWLYKDGNHTSEDFNYIVLESGRHTLPGGLEIEAGFSNTNKEYANYSSGSETDSKSVSFSSSLSNPIVITSITSYHVNRRPVTSRVFNVSNSGFNVALQEEEDEGGHSDETIDYIAIEQGTVDDSTNSPNWKLESDSVSGVTNSKKTFNFTASFSSAPFVIAGMQTIDGTDPATLRLDSTTNSSVQLHVEEEKSSDSEVGHAAEEVGYIAIQGLSNSYNIALAVQNKPSGLLQDIESKVRLGVSFYRYNPNAGDIYNGNTIQGGTLKFKIPNNPFVKKPSDSALPLAEQGYRELTGYIGSDINDIVDVIENYPLVWGTTPLAENLWEVIQYFEQDTPYYTDVISGYKDYDVADNANPERDPYYFSEYGKKLECVKSSVIIFTDGEPYKDADIPSTIQDYDDDTASKDVASTDPNQHGADNLDDVAYWGYCNKSSGACTSASGGSRDLRTDISNLTDLDGNSIPQYLTAYTVGFAGGSIRPILQDTADNAGGIAYAAEDGAALKTALEEAFTAAIDDSSASSVNVSTGSITGTSAVFHARFESNDWSGEVNALPINSDGSLGDEVLASVIPAASSRKIITYNGTQGAPFQWPATPASPTSTEITVAQQALLNDNELLLDYLRGDQSLEEQNGGSFRNRDSLLAGIIHAAPMFVDSTPVFPYPNDWGNGAPENGSTYASFKSTISALNSGAGRKPAVYVAANGGMLHAFDATISEDSDNDGVPEFSANFGQEIFAYAPNVTFGKLAPLGDPNYSHQYSVDGTPTIVDAFYDSNWHTVLAAGLRSGGQGIYALDVTNPDNFNTESNASNKVLWEFTDDDDDGDDSDGNVGEKGDNDLGYTFSQPNIVRMKNGVWAAVFGNGYNNTETDSSSSSTGNAVLYIVNLQTGALIKKFDTGVGISNSASGGKPNGLSTVAPIDIDNDYIVDYIYGGDLYGNLWKFDVSFTDINSWVIDYSGQPLFTACADIPCTDTNHQPITTRPQVGRHESGSGYMVYFGTGQYIETNDNLQAGQLNQTFYGIWDKDEASLTSFSRSDLLPQSILKEISQGFDTDQDPLTQDNPSRTPADGFDAFFDLRVTTDEPILSTHLGWYIDLYNTENGNTNNYGEKQVSDPVLRNDRIIFTTLLPSDDPCAEGGSGWLMELDAHSGSRLEYSPFDLNGDDHFSSNDYVEIEIVDDNGDTQTIEVPVSGKKSKVGIIQTPGIVDDKTKEFKYNSGSTGEIEITTENPGPDFSGRQSWIQLEL